MNREFLPYYHPKRTSGIFVQCKNCLMGFSGHCHASGFYQYNANGECTHKLTGGYAAQNIQGHWWTFLLLLLSLNISFVQTQAQEYSPPCDTIYFDCFNCQHKDTVEINDSTSAIYYFEVFDSAGVYSEYYYDNGNRVVGCYPETKLHLTIISKGKHTEYLLNRKEFEKIIDGAILKNMTFSSCHYFETTGNSCYFNCLMCVPETDICVSIIASIDILTRKINYQIHEEDYEDD